MHVQQALDYKQRILEALPQGTGFEPLMTLYLTDKTPPEEVEAAKQAGIVAFKLYPAGATTNSDSGGVTDIAHCMDTLCAMAEVGTALPQSCLKMGCQSLGDEGDSACSAGRRAAARAWRGDGCRR